MAITALQRHQLKKLIKELSKHKGRHTELVTVYIPQGYDLNKIINHLSQEQGTASNIKSTSTRKNVQDALERMIQHLRLFKKTPTNGLCAFSGNVAEREGQSDVKVWSIEPPIPLKQRIYRCDKLFVLDALDDMVSSKEVYGLVVLDRRDAQLALLKGKSIVPLKKTHSEVPGKMRAGGQCYHPYSLIRINDNVEIPLSEIKIGQELSSYDFTKRTIITSTVTDKWEVEKDLLYSIRTSDNTMSKCSADHLFFVKKNDEIKEISADELEIDDTLLAVNGGPEEKEITITEIKKEEGDHKLIDISVKNQNFIANGIIVHNSAARFARLREGATKDHYKKIADYMKDNFLKLKELKGIILGGPGVTVNDFMNKDYLTGDLKKKIIGTKDLSYTDEFGLQELLDKSQDLLASEEVSEEKKIMQKFFDILNKTPGKVAYGEEIVLQQTQGGVVETLLLSEALDDEKLDEFEKEAEKLGTEVKIISTDTREGVQLEKIGKVAAILRYEV